VVLASGISKPRRVIGVLAFSIAALSTGVIEVEHLQVHPSLLYANGFVGMTLLLWGVYDEGPRKHYSPRKMTWFLVWQLAGVVVLVPLTVLAAIAQLPFALQTGGAIFAVYGAGPGIPSGNALGLFLLWRRRGTLVKVPGTRVDGS